MCDPAESAIVAVEAKGVKKANAEHIIECNSSFALLLLLLLWDTPITIASMGDHLVLQNKRCSVLASCNDTFIAQLRERNNTRGSFQDKLLITFQFGSFQKNLLMNYRFFWAHWNWIVSYRYEARVRGVWERADVQNKRTEIPLNFLTKASHAQSPIFSPRSVHVPCFLSISSCLVD